MLEDVKENKIFRPLLSTISPKGSLVFYCFSNIFNVTSLFEESLSLIVRYFSVVTESNNFVDLDFTCLRKILTSGELNIDSELQVLNAADRWLRHNVAERGKHARDLLSKVRLSLLSAPALRQILDKISVFSASDECGDIIKTALSNERRSINRNVAIRYCNQSDFELMVCGGGNVETSEASRDVKRFRANNLLEAKKMARMNEGRGDFGAVCVGGDAYVFGGTDWNLKCVRSVERYTRAGDAWEHVTDIGDDRKHFSVCPFMENVLVVGGFVKGRFTATCLQFNTKTLGWRETAEMSEARCYAACSVYQGRVVVCGGIGDGRLKDTVEAYDHVADAWSKMPKMVKRRKDHRSVSVKSKLFVVGGNLSQSCEVFSSTTNKFTLLKEPAIDFGGDPVEMIAIGTDLFVFFEKGIVLVYDFDNDKWSKKECEATKNLVLFSCAKLLLK